MNQLISNLLKDFDNYDSAKNIIQFSIGGNDLTIDINNLLEIITNDQYKTISKDSEAYFPIISLLLFNSAISTKHIDVFKKLEIISNSEEKKGDLNYSTYRLLHYIFKNGLLNNRNIFEFVFETGLSFYGFDNLPNLLKNILLLSQEQEFKEKDFIAHLINIVFEPVDK